MLVRGDWDTGPEVHYELNIIQNAKKTGIQGTSVSCVTADSHQKIPRTGDKASID